MKNALSVDVEDYFMVENFASRIPFERWGEYPLRLAQSAHSLLDLFGERRVKATFFVLGWVAERLPQLVRAIAGAGHEVACHGYSHRRVGVLGPARFKDEISKAKQVLENLSRKKVEGYRAATYSVGAQTPWAWDILAEAGFSYDSSYLPMGWRRLRGFPVNRPGKIKTPKGNELWEFPISVRRVAGFGIPFCGGGYLRLFSEAMVCAQIARFNARGLPANVFLHPWEVDPEQPRLPASPLARFRHYVNLSGALRKLDALLGKFEFAPVQEVLGL